MSSNVIPFVKPNKPKAVKENPEIFDIEATMKENQEKEERLKLERKKANELVKKKNKLK